VTSFSAPVVAWAAPDDRGRPLVVLLHGRGADEAGIIGLADHLPQGPSYAAVRAPTAEGGGFAWFANGGIGAPVAESLAETILDGISGRLPRARVRELASVASGSLSTAAVLNPGEPVHRDHFFPVSPCLGPVLQPRHVANTCLKRPRPCQVKGTEWRVPFRGQSGYSYGRRAPDASGPRPSRTRNPERDG
jgi:hypothetical protein